MSYLGSNSRLGDRSYFVNVFPGHECYEDIDRLVKEYPGKVIEVWEEKENGHYRLWAEFDGKDRARLSVGKKKHITVRAE